MKTSSFYAVLITQTFFVKNAKFYLMNSATHKILPLDGGGLALSKVEG
jgi:hypothetical protein